MNLYDLNLRIIYIIGAHIEVKYEKFKSYNNMQICI